MPDLFGTPIPIDPEELQIGLEKAISMTDDHEPRGMSKQRTVELKAHLQELCSRVAVNSRTSFGTLALQNSFASGSIQQSLPDASFNAPILRDNISSVQPYFQSNFRLESVEEYNTWAAEMYQEFSESYNEKKLHPILSYI